ncbi:35335_t:CDS:2 [Gigaspora margarita]|uniref:35335_t:CDS:1 n=1 Tax=Gigaspora margarita TaxID=4874 RepID=A0ABN7WJZ4_GIGMA|nr:35335_t:CDS:2 [Gigaspora margarita]
MDNPNQPTPSSDLVNQLAQLLQQLQTTLISSQTKFYQRSLKEPCYTFVVRPNLYNNVCELIDDMINTRISAKKEPKNSEQEVPRERMNSYQNDKDPLNDIQNLFNCGCDYQNGIRIDNSKYEASEYNQALTPTSLDLLYFYQNGTNVEEKGQ